MLFNSITFVLFFAVVLVTYWLIAKTEKSKIFSLFIASLIFYGYWSVNLLMLMVSCITVNYFLAILIHAKKFKYLTLFAILVNIALLCYFKYTNFFIDILNDLSTKSLPHYKIILPIGISFYTFQCLGYILDVSKNDIEPEKNYIYFTTFVIFFPHLVAGPIQRSKHLLPQFRQIHSVDNQKVVTALNLIALGYLKKIVIADSLSPYVNDVFSNYLDFGSGEILLASIYFSAQIYCDFSGYSDIARGCSRLLGFELMENFKLPYLSKNITEFWQRWHISLSTWFKDYLFIPLGGNRNSKWRNAFNYFLVFTISGIWHGANYTFLIWGSIHGLLLIIDKNIQHFFTIKLPGFLTAIFTFFSVNMLWIYFRAPNLSTANYMVSQIILHPSLPKYQRLPLIYFFLLVIIEFIFYNNKINQLNRYLKLSIYSAIVLIIVNYLTTSNEQQFIYFDF